MKNMEMPNLQPNKLEPKIKLPEKSSSELEGENFSDYVIEILRKKGEHALADSIEEKKISLGLEARKAIEAGNQAERSNPNFNPADHINMRTEMVANDLIKNKNERLH